MKDDPETKTDLAAERTDWAEDRTLLANERTLAGWMRTGLGSVGIGVGLHALFRSAEPTWVAKSAATVFLGIAVLIFVVSLRKSREARQRLSAHTAKPVDGHSLTVVAIALSVATVLVAVILWFL